MTTLGELLDGRWTPDRRKTRSRCLKSIDFFTSLGFTFNPQFTDEAATCMIVGETLLVMLLTEAKFKTITPKPICDATKSTEVLVCLSSESRAKVDETVRKGYMNP